MKCVEVALPGREYGIHIGRGALGGAGEAAARLAGGGALAVVSDETVWALYGGAFGEAMEKAHRAFYPVVVPPGEGSKTLDGLKEVYAGFAAAGLQRNGLVAAFGGGVVGDLAGFAAATWMRGVRCIQLPTTLLAQVDSSVGGKTAVNLPDGKNLAGVFHQPVCVLADTALLESLPARQRACGMAEVIKCGAIFSPELFERAALPLSGEALEEAIAECCRLKSLVVCEDERDVGRRMLLNFGHTFGHAIEALGDFKTFNHGEAVAAGMVVAAAVGCKMGLTPAHCAPQLRVALAGHGLPTACPFTARQLLGRMALDKKGEAQGVNLILLEAIGRAKTLFVRFQDLGALLEEGV